MYFAKSTLNTAESNIIVEENTTEISVQEIAPGVHLHRRQILKFGFLGSILPLVGNPWQSLEAKNTAYNFNAFVNEIKPLAKNIISGKTSIEQEDNYIQKIASLLTQVNFSTTKPQHQLSFNEGKSMEPMLFDSPLVILDITFQPHAKISLHDHKDYNGVIYVSEGEIKANNFDFYGDRPENSTPHDFIIQRTQQATLTQGMTSTLARKRNNIHEIVAGKQGAKLVDVFTFFKEDSGSHYINWDSKAFDKEKQLFKANWKN